MKVYEIVSENLLSKAVTWVAKYYDDIKNARGIVTANKEMLKRLEPFIEKSADDFAEAVVNARTKGTAQDPKLYDFMEKKLDPAIKNDPDKLKAVLDEINKRSAAKIDAKLKPSGTAPTPASTGPTITINSAAKTPISWETTAVKMAAINKLAGMLNLANELRLYLQEVNKLDKNDPKYNEKRWELAQMHICKAVSALVTSWFVGKQIRAVEGTLTAIFLDLNIPRNRFAGALASTGVRAWYFTENGQNFLNNIICYYLAGAMGSAYDLATNLLKVSVETATDVAVATQNTSRPDAEPVMGPGSQGKSRYMYGQKIADNDGYLTNDVGILTIVADDPDFKRDLRIGRNFVADIPRRPGTVYPPDLMKKLGLN